MRPGAVRRGKHNTMPPLAQSALRHPCLGWVKVMVRKWDENSRHGEFRTMRSSEFDEPRSAEICRQLSSSPTCYGKDGASNQRLENRQLVGVLCKRSSASKRCAASGFGHLFGDALTNDSGFCLSGAMRHRRSSAENDRGFFADSALAQFEPNGDIGNRPIE